jgi:hypothetical protein
MPTKTIVIGEPEQPNTPPTPIELCKFLSEDLTIKKTDFPARGYNYVELICRNYCGYSGSDLIFAYDDPKKRSCGTLFIGEWNEGVVD